MDHGVTKKNWSEIEINLENMTEFLEKNFETIDVNVVRYIDLVCLLGRGAYGLVSLKKA